MDAAETYGLLRALTTPIVAVTSAWQGRLNGMIANSAIRASLVPDRPRVAVFILKRNLSHDMIYRSGAFALHLLHAGQWETIRQLGLDSGRERDKISQLPYRVGATGCPLLEDAYARFDCRVANAMDAGSATCFLGEPVAVERGSGAELMTSGYFRENMPEDLRSVYERNLAAAQAWAAEFADEIQPLIWPGLEGAD